VALLSARPQKHLSCAWPAQDWRQAEPEKVTNFPESGLFLEDPQISRDGHWLLYSRGRITGDIWIMNLEK
jgi:hypothetical protein